MSDSNHYSREWKDYRRRRLCVWIALLVLPLWILPGRLLWHEAALLFQLNRATEETVWWAAVVVPYLSLLVITSARWFYWRCPRCRRPFHATSSRYSTTNKKCLHCGLQKW